MNPPAALVRRRLAPEEAELLWLDQTMTIPRQDMHVGKRQWWERAAAACSIPTYLDGTVPHTVRGSRVWDP